MFKMGPWELGLIVLIIFVVFGAGKLPEVAGAIGKGIHAFRSGQSGKSEDDDKAGSKAEKSDSSPE